MNFLYAKSGAVRVVAADLSKAFDKLPFESILSCLVNFGLSRQAVLFLADFLSGRKQRVRFGGLFSEWSSVTSGVPQGSVVGPILFTMVIDSLSPLCNNTVYIKYADDITVLHFVRSKDDDMLQHEWSHIENWSRSVGLCLNYGKCVVMNCVTKKSLDLCEIRTADDNVLASVSSLHLLGVTFSSDLTWNLHVEEIIKKCYRRFFILRNLKRASCPPFLIHRCYVLFIRSVLLYCFSCFCNLPDYLFYRLLQVEKRAAKFFPDHDYHALSLTAESMCLKLFNKIENCPNHPLRVMFQPRTPIPRNPKTLKAPFTKTSRFYKSFIRFSRH
ncbi:MAG: reverse transcriptase domain-containing protein [Pseudomonadota bacterium]